MDNELLIRYVNHFKEVYDGNPWYGDTITSKLDGITDELAFVRPMEGVHSIAEVVSHMTYWRQSLISRLKGDGSFKASVESEHNWRDLSQLRAMGWGKVRKEFEASQQAVVDSLSTQPAGILAKEYADGRTFDYLVQGVMDHDIYHLGQIGLIRKMVPR